MEEIVREQIRFLLENREEDLKQILKIIYLPKGDILYFISPEINKISMEVVVDFITSIWNHPEMETIRYKLAPKSFYSMEGEEIYVSSMPIL